jgi:cytoskeletal protein CcmA (bactofilin family)
MNLPYRLYPWRQVMKRLRCALPTPSPGSTIAADRATIGKSLQIKGELIGCESLYIDGKVEGAITLPDSRVTVSRDALGVGEHHCS